MKTIDVIRDWIQKLLKAPVDRLGRWARFARFQIRLWPHCFRRLRRNNLLTMSSALAFRTIFAMVPIIVLAVLVVKAVGMAELGRESLWKALEFTGITRLTVSRDRFGEEIEGPPRPEEVMMSDRLEHLIDSVEQKLTLGKVGPIGSIIFIWTALTLVSTMENSLNRVFGAPHARPFARRMLLYWSVITLFPVLLAAADYAGRRIAAGVPELPVLSWFLAALGWLQPVLIGVLLLAAVYVLMPNTRVRVSTALAGATTAVLLWLVAKWAFGLYVTNLVGRGSLYGTLGLIPLFLFWMNISWILFLFGAQLAHTAGNLKALEAADRARGFVCTSRDVLAGALAVAIPYQDGSGPVPDHKVADKLALPPESVESLMQRLVALGVVSRVELKGEEGCVLARPAEKIPVLHVMEIGDDPSGMSDRVYPDEISRRIDAFRKRAEGVLGEVTLADLVAEKEET